MWASSCCRHGSWPWTIREYPGFFLFWNWDFDGICQPRLDATDSGGAGAEDIDAHIGLRAMCGPATTEVSSYSCSLSPFHFPDWSGSAQPMSCISVPPAGPGQPDHDDHIAEAGYSFHGRFLGPFHGGWRQRSGYGQALIGHVRPLMLLQAPTFEVRWSPAGLVWLVSSVPPSMWRSIAPCNRCRTTTASVTPPCGRFPRRRPGDNASRRRILIEHYSLWSFASASFLGRHLGRCPAQPVLYP